MGARLDAKPELLFRLRAVNENDLVADIGAVLPMSKHDPAAGKVLEGDDVAALFGLDMGDVAGPDEVVRPAAVALTPAAVAVTPPAVAVTPAVVAVTPPAGKAPAVRKRAVQPVVPKVGRKGAVASVKPEPKPVEWWKATASKQLAKGRVAARETVRSGAGRKARAAS